MSRKSRARMMLGRARSAPLEDSGRQIRRRGLPRRRDPMPAKFQELADYNTRVSKGITHSPGYMARMVLLQREFDEWNAAQVQ